MFVESVGPNSEAVRGVACVDGANRCPPEDVGGTAGYIEFLQEVRDPTHDAHRDALTWAGGAFDPASFDLKLVNALLRSGFAV